MKDGFRERRRFVRIESRWVIYYRVLEERGFQRGRTDNVSEGGIKFRSRRLFPAGKPLEIKMSLPAFSSFINFQGRVVWSQPNKSKDYYDTGICIVKIKAKDREKLKKQIDAFCMAKSSP